MWPNSRSRWVLFLVDIFLLALNFAFGVLNILDGSWFAVISFLACGVILLSMWYLGKSQQRLIVSRHRLDIAMSHLQFVPCYACGGSGCNYSPDSDGLCTVCHGLGITRADVELGRLDG